MFGAHWGSWLLSFAVDVVGELGKCRRENFKNTSVSPSLLPPTPSHLGEEGLWEWDLQMLRVVFLCLYRYFILNGVLGLFWFCLFLKWEERFSRGAISGCNSGDIRSGSEASGSLAPARVTELHSECKDTRESKGSKDLCVWICNHFSGNK